MPDETSDQHPSPLDEPAQASVEPAEIEGQLRHAQELLAEIRRQRDELERQVETQRQQIEQDAAARADLHRLIAGLEDQLHMLRTPAGQAERREGSLPIGWREGKRGLGASLTLTGVAALAAGIVLHFALQERLLISAAHLGYIIGLVGVLTFLLGLLLVY